MLKWLLLDIIIMYAMLISHWRILLMNKLLGMFINYL